MLQSKNKAEGDQNIIQTAHPEVIRVREDTECYYYSKIIKRNYPQDIDSPPIIAWN